VEIFVKIIYNIRVSMTLIIKYFMAFNAIEKKTFKIVNISVKIYYEVKKKVYFESTNLQQCVHLLIMKIIF